MIELTKEEILMVIKTLSMIEGFLFTVKESSAMFDSIQPSIDMLTGKVINEKLP